MSTFAEAAHLTPHQCANEINEILESDTFNINAKEIRNKLASLFSILTMQSLSIRREMKINTYRSYKSAIGKSLSFDKDDKIIKFTVRLRKTESLQKDIESALPSYKVVVSPFKNQEVSLFDRYEETHKYDASMVGLQFTNILSKEKDIWKIVSRIACFFDQSCVTTTKRAEYRLLLLGAVGNCCRYSDLKNLDPRTFEIYNNSFLGPIVRATVTETKSRTERYVNFYPVNGDCDLLISLYDYLRVCSPIEKTVSSNRPTNQTHQFLPESLARTFSRFLTQHVDEPVFKIWNGPKSHFGRHLMATFLSRSEKGKYVSSLGNWAGDREIQSAVARSHYSHGSVTVDDRVFAFISGFYKEAPLGSEIYVLKDPSNKPLSREELLEEEGNSLGSPPLSPPSSPRLVAQSFSAHPSLQLFEQWHGIISDEVLQFIAEYRRKHELRSQRTVVA
uniref:Recombinase Flp protein n=1 Tax=Kluyveromyces lactis TaxID=28985 RepID=FLP_KLULC|nr:RecName: Full=Recombinase Flp protein [Kluyveromyces lactis]CAA27591.1 unnamed protein product [Kluyveromyces lactis]